MKLTTRRAMVAVAVLAVLLGIARIAVRRQQFLARAQYHASQAVHYRTLVTSSAAVLEDYRAGRPGLEGDYGAGVRTYSDQVRRFAPIADHHAAMARKYRAASARPWLGAGPDPPPPAAWADRPNPDLED